MKVKNKNFERNEKIYEQRKLGKTYKSIGLEFGLSIEQIRAIYFQHERLKLKIKQGGIFLLSVRAQNVIKNYSHEDDFDWSFNSLMKVPNCGLNTTKEILEYIEGLG